MATFDVELNDGVVRRDASHEHVAAIRLSTGREREYKTCSHRGLSTGRERGAVYKEGESGTCTEGCLQGGREWDMHRGLYTGRERVGHVHIEGCRHVHVYFNFLCTWEIQSSTYRRSSNAIDYK